MDSILRHNLKLALPLIVAFVAVPLGLMAAHGLWQVATLNTQAGTMTAVIGDGLDTFTAATGSVVGTFLQSVQDNYGVLAIIALVATAISVVEAIRRMRAALRAPDDMSRLASYVSFRTRRFLAASEPPHQWGSVRDSKTGDPVMLARVGLVDASGKQLASVVTDARGRYGFAIPSESAVHGIGLTVRKSGYYDLPPLRPSLTVGIAPTALDLKIDRTRTARKHIANIRRMPAHLAFIAGALTVPIVALSAGTIGTALAAVFGVSGAVNLLINPER
ncbi:MAG TPA: hypothetical protein VMU12_01430 [Candidatus Paceibacterota bacterium]|nr:hypothetical protein [Candidatus Paceibacterota bacterium]